MRYLLTTALLALVVSTVSAQETRRLARLSAAMQAYMKYMCYTCHGTIGQGADRGAGPKARAGIASVSGLCPADAHAAPRYAGLSAAISERSGIRGHLRVSRDG